MPEGDTIARAARVLHLALAGQPTTGFESTLAQVMAANLDRPVTGRVVDQVSAHGKHLVMHFSGGLLLRTHMRMRGAWHLYRPGERWQRGAHAMRVRLDTAAWVAVAFDVYDAELVPAASARELRVIASLGPDLGDPAVDASAAAARLRAAGERAVGEVVLDQRVVAGLGNVLRAEVLYLAGVHPRRPAAGLTEGESERLIAHAIGQLRHNARPEAGMRRTTGRMALDERLWVYQRTGLPCRRCGTPVASEQPTPDGRRVYWCPTCQPASERLDDRGSSAPGSEASRPSTLRRQMLGATGTAVRPRPRRR